MPSLGFRCGALVLLFDAATQSSWETVVSGWGSELMGQAPEIVLLVAEGEADEADSEESKAETIRRVEWSVCLVPDCT